MYLHQCKFSSPITSFFSDVPTAISSWWCSTTPGILPPRNLCTGCVFSLVTFAFPRGLERLPLSYIIGLYIQTHFFVLFMVFFLNHFWLMFIHWWGSISGSPAARLALCPWARPQPSLPLIKVGPNISHQRSLYSCFFFKFSFLHIVMTTCHILLKD